MTTADPQNSADHLLNGMSDGAHHWMMMICCIPMIIAVVLVATGIAGAGLIFAAVMCSAIMWLMMRAVSGSRNT